MFSTRSASRQSPEKKRGATLLESIIVMGLMTVILAATHTFLSGGVSFYQNSVQSLEVQQQALVGLTRMASEIENSNRDKIIVETVNPAPQQRDAIIIPSLQAADGSTGTSGSGRNLWKSFVCFMPLVLPEGDLLVRKQDMLGLPAPENEGVSYPPDPLRPPGSGPVRDAAFFSGRKSTGVLARHLDSFKVTTTTDAVTLELRISFTAKRKADKMTIVTEVYPKN